MSSSNLLAKAILEARVTDVRTLAGAFKTKLGDAIGGGDRSFHSFGSEKVMAALSSIPPSDLALQRVISEMTVNNLLRFSEEVNSRFPRGFMGISIDEYDADKFCQILVEAARSTAIKG